MTGGDGIRRRFAEVVEAKEHADESVEAGRVPIDRDLRFATTLRRMSITCTLSRASIIWWQGGRDTAMAGQRSSEMVEEESWSPDGSGSSLRYDGKAAFRVIRS
jgi:hypothetical protein